MDKKAWEQRIQLVEETLVKELDVDNGLVPELEDSMKYSLTAGGKRLRPVLLMSAADAVGANGADFVQVACALEMIHTYSLIHDDLPAMDNDDYRRGKLTNHKVYGEALAILAGDALLTQAFEVMVRQKNVPAEVLVQVVREISQAAGPNGMVGGQVLDMLSEGKHISIKELEKMHMGKTGALIRACIRCGAILGGATPEQLEALTNYANCLGLVFQITDDILDVTGDEAVIGKPVGSDLRNEKATYVTLTSVEEATRMAEEGVAQAVKYLEGFGEGAAFLEYTVKSLLGRKK